MADRAPKVRNSRLARNFHRTFAPEKQYLGKLLQYAAGNGVYDMQAIAVATGIPTGVSSGKALPTADYCIGMGLVKAEKVDSVETLTLTTFGRTVLLEDKFFREPITQWLAHLNLCDKVSGAEVWYQTFWGSTSVLGVEFTKNSLNEWLCSVLRISKQNILGPTLRMYEDETSFSACGAVSTSGETILRKKPPRAPSFAYGYAAWFAASIERAGRAGSQITVDELEDFCGFRSITQWNVQESHELLSILEQKGLISVDRLMRPWIICMKHSAESLWKRLYEDFI
jgi:hypothetical protein